MMLVNECTALEKTKISINTMICSVDIKDPELATRTRIQVQGSEIQEESLRTTLLM